MKRIIAFILASVMLLCSFGCAKKDGGKDKETGDVIINEGGLGIDDAVNGIILDDVKISKENVAKTDKSAPAVWSDSTIVTQNMYVYFYNAYYRNFLETYKDSLSTMGLDTSKALSAQQYNEEYTWQQYITLQVYSQLREMMALADAAKADGMKLDKSAKAEIDSQAASILSVAKEADYELEKFIEDTYGKGVTVDVMRAALSVRYLANKYYNKLWEGYSFSDDDCLEYYKKNSHSFLHYDVIKMTVEAEDAKKLEACTDEESFVKAIREIITERSFLGDYDRFADTIEAQVKKKYCYRMDYNKYTELGKWAVEEGREPYDIHTKKESSGKITVSMILPTTDGGAISEVLYRDDVPVKNVMYMAFADSEGTTGKVKAESILKNWQEDPTASRFEDLMKKYDGGKAEGVYRGQFSDAVNGWVFDEARKAGDCAVVEDEGGAYLIYMMEDGDPSWIADVRETLKENKYADDVDGFIKKYPTKYDSAIVYSVVEVSVKASENAAE